MCVGKCECVGVSVCVCGWDCVNSSLISRTIGGHLADPGTVAGHLAHFWTSMNTAPE